MRTQYQLGKVHCGTCGEYVSLEEVFLSDNGRTYHRWCGKLVSLDAKAGRKQEKPTRDAMPR